MGKLICTIGLILFTLLFGFGQSLPANRRAQRAFETASGQLSLGRYEEAMTSLELAIALDPGFAAAHQQLGDIFRRRGAYEKAVTHYMQVIQLDSTLTPLTWFGMGESLLHTGKYADALTALRRYQQSSGVDEAGKRRTAKYIADCEFSLAALQRPQPFSPHNAGPAINTIHDEYFPRLTADHGTIIFTRKADDRENFYASTKDSSGRWQPAELLQGDVNSALYNEGAHSISPDGKYLFFTGCNRPDGLGSCDIYVARREGDRWGTPHNLGAPVNTRGWEAQPALSADGRTLYFVSNRPGGQGGYDIWYSVLAEDGSWSSPRNLGPVINTPYEEGSPYIHADNQTLYFVSDGWPGFGNKDIFRSELDSAGRWQRPVNLGYPINDHHEQRALSVSMNGREAFFSTKRADTSGGLDIYSFELPPNVRPHPVAYLTGAIVDAESGRPIPAEVRLTDITTDREVYQEQADYEDGNFLAPLPFGRTYALHIRQPGYLFFSAHYPLNDSAYVNERYEVRVALSPIKKGKTGTLSNIFFDTDRYELLPKSRTELNNLIGFLNDNENVRIEVAGHTDNTGSEAHNQTLSENRARAVYNYLVQAGIPSSRLQYRGYGASRPVAGNETEAGRQQNRRTDFTVIAITK